MSSKSAEISLDSGVKVVATTKPDGPDFPTGSISLDAPLGSGEWTPEEWIAIMKSAASMLNDWVTGPTACAVPGLHLEVRLDPGVDEAPGTVELWSTRDDNKFAVAAFSTEEWAEIVVLTSAVILLN